MNETSAPSSSHLPLRKSVGSTIKSIQDIMRKDDGVDGDAQRLAQLTWMLFLKVFDQREEEWEAATKNQKKPYASPIPDTYRWRNWAKYLPDLRKRLVDTTDAAHRAKIALQIAELRAQAIVAVPA